MNALRVAFVVSLCLFAALVEARDSSERRAFVRENPKPADCVRCEVDHKQALANGGADKKSNMQWLSREEHKAKTREDMREYRRKK